jgi:hypothetical protein
MFCFNNLVTILIPDHQFYLDFYRDMRVPTALVTKYPVNKNWSVKRT